MENINMVKRIVKTYDYLNQRDIFSEECAELIFAMEDFGVRNIFAADYDALSGRYVDTNILKERGALFDEMADVYIMCWEMCMYLGEDTVDAFLASHNMLANNASTDIQRLAKIIKQISKCKRNDAVTNVKEAFEEFEDSLYDLLCSFSFLGEVSKDILDKKVTEKLTRQMARMDTDEASNDVVQGDWSKGESQ